MDGLNKKDDAKMIVRLVREYVSYALRYISRPNPDWKKFEREMKFAEYCCHLGAHIDDK